MKKTLTTAFSLLVCFLTSNAQVENLKGIGKFKIMESKASTLIPELEKEMGITVTKQSESYNPYLLDKSNSYIVEFVYDSINNKAASEYNYCKGAKVYLIKSYKIADIPFEKIWLTFYNDTLIQFDCKGSEDIASAMKTKYGKGEESSITLENPTCLDDDIHNTSTWKNGDIEAVALKKISYNSDCESSTYRNFVVKSAKLVSHVTHCNVQESLLIRQKKEEEKKKKLSDF